MVLAVTKYTDKKQRVLLSEIKNNFVCNCVLFEPKVDAMLYLVYEGDHLCVHSEGFDIGWETLKLNEEQFLKYCKILNKHIQNTLSSGRTLSENAESVFRNLQRIIEKM